NFEIPKDVDSYTHRVGRTARAGKKGEAISLVATPEEKKFFKQILFAYRGSITMKDTGDVPVTVTTTFTATPSTHQKSRNKKRPPEHSWKKKWQKFMHN
ncbi:MAG TPA: hypothetical protein VKI62_01790, partial [Bacteroidota bacterium]|nr:hypothetical protein [Bacteroidota bacterium]